ncbi:MAG: TadE/TadG family type IV pilus assembly protein [Paracoccaceae bacterium]
MIRRSERPTMRRFLRETRGTGIVEAIVMILPVFTLFLVNIDVVLAFWSMNAADKAAHTAARIASVSEPVYRGSDFYDAASRSVRRNQLVRALYVDNGPSCYQHNAPSACIVPNDDAWFCEGWNLGGSCDAEGFEAIVAEVQRFHPMVRTGDVTIQYVYRQLGTACTPMIPEVRVTIAARAAPTITGFTLLGMWGRGHDGRSASLGQATASALGEDLKAPNAPSGAGGPC